MPLSCVCWLESNRLPRHSTLWPEKTAWCQTIWKPCPADSAPPERTLARRQSTVTSRVSAVWGHARRSAGAKRVSARKSMLCFFINYTMAYYSKVTVGRILSRRGSFTHPVSFPPLVSCTGGGNELEEEAAMSKCRHWEQNAGDLEQCWRKEAHAQNKQVDKLCVCARALVCVHARRTCGEGWAERWAGPVAAGRVFLNIYFYFQPLAFLLSFLLWPHSLTLSLCLSLRRLLPQHLLWLHSAEPSFFCLFCFHLRLPLPFPPRFFSRSNGINNLFYDFPYLPLHCSSRFAGVLIPSLCGTGSSGSNRAPLSPEAAEIKFYLPFFPPLDVLFLFLLWPVKVTTVEEKVGLP